MTVRGECHEIQTVTGSNVKGTLKYSLVKVKRGKSKKYKKYFKIDSKYEQGFGFPEPCFRASGYQK